MIRPLTSLRFFAALAVFFSHLSMFAGDRTFDWVWRNVWSQGYAGVTFFFILSGFILTYAYADRIDGDRGSLLRYAAARVGRIWPVHALTVLLAIPIVLGDSSALKLAGTGALNLLLLHPFVPVESVYFSFNSPSWSLGNELLFYLLLPFALVALRRRRPPSARTALLVALAVWLVSTAIVVAGRDAASAHWLFYVNPVFRLGDFVIGTCLALAVRDRLRQRGITTPQRRWTLLELAAIASIGATIVLAAFVPKALTYGVLYQPAFTATIVVFAFGRGRISAWLSHPVPVYLGEISFSFYMLHLLAIGYVGEALGTGTPLVTSTVALAGALVASAVVFRHYETPLRFRAQRWAKQVTTSPAETVAPGPVVARVEHAEPVTR